MLTFFQLNTVIVLGELTLTQENDEKYKASSSQVLANQRTSYRVYLKTSHFDVAFPVYTFNLYFLH